MYTHFSLQDRESIEIHLNRGATQKEIAKVLEKSEPSISREIERNSVTKKGRGKREYKAIEAHFKAYLRRHQAKSQSMKINFNSEMQNFIIEHLQRTDMELAPKTIANIRNQSQSDKKKHITHTSIYKWLETGMGNKYKEFLLYKNKGYKKRKPQTEKVKIKGRVPIEKRPETINKREEKGHMEGDLIVSKKGDKSALLTLIDRKTRLPRMFKLKDKSSKNIMDLIAGIKEEVGIKSITFDNGMEFAYHYLLNDIGIDTYFCNPYSSREKGSIENLNRIIRRFFPKGTILSDIPKEKIRSICDIIANTPREILGFVSPNQAHFSM